MYKEGYLYQWVIVIIYNSIIFIYLQFGDVKLKDK